MLLWCGMAKLLLTFLSYNRLRKARLHSLLKWVFGHGSNLAGSPLPLFALHRSVPALPSYCLKSPWEEKSNLLVLVFHSDISPVTKTEDVASPVSTPITCHTRKWHNEMYSCFQNGAGGKVMQWLHAGRATQLLHYDMLDFVVLRSKVSTVKVICNWTTVLICVLQVHKTWTQKTVPLNLLWRKFNNNFIEIDWFAKAGGGLSVAPGGQHLYIMKIRTLFYNYCNYGQTVSKQQQSSILVNTTHDASSKKNINTNLIFV